MKRQVSEFASRPAGTAPEGPLYQALADAFEQVALAAERLPDPSGEVGTWGPCNPPVALDAAVLCHAASEMLARGSDLSFDSARLAIASVTKLRGVCEARIDENPRDHVARACIARCTRCEDAYLSAYLEIRGFSLGS